MDSAELGEMITAIEEREMHEFSWWGKLTEEEVVNSTAYAWVETLRTYEDDELSMPTNWLELEDLGKAFVQSQFQKDSDIQRLGVRFPGLESKVISKLMELMQAWRIHHESSKGGESEGEEGEESEEETSEEGEDSEEEVSGESVDGMEVEIKDDVPAVLAAEAAHDNERPAANNESTTSLKLLQHEA